MGAGESGFWREAVAVAGSATPRVAPRVLAFGALAAAVTVAAVVIEWAAGVRLGVEVAPYEIAGAVLGLLLVYRTTTGYDRWWEARKLWGGIVNQTRNLVVTGLAHGPPDPGWRDRFVRWAAAFPHAARALLRGDPLPPEADALLGPDADPVRVSPHPPCAIALGLGRQLRAAVEHHGMSPFAFAQADRERALLIDHVGACERILRTPMPRVYGIKIRRFILLFLATLPFGLLHKLGADWLVPVMTMGVAYAVLSLDQIGVELQNPFARRNLSHLPLEEIAAGIERVVTGLLAADAPPVRLDTPGTGGYCPAAVTEGER